MPIDNAIDALITESASTNRGCDYQEQRDEDYHDEI